MTKKEARQWTSRSIGSAFQHKIFYVLIRIGGWRLAYLVLYFVALYYVLFRPSVRKRCGYYLSHRFPGQVGLQRLKSCYQLSLELGKVLIDRAVVGILGVDRMSASFDDKKILYDLISEGKGIIFLMAHVGSWQVALSALHFLKTPVNMVIHREEGDVDRHYFEHRSLEWPYRIIDPEGFLGGTLEMTDALKKGEILCMMGDRLFGNLKNTLSIRFLGEDALFPFSAMKIASTSGAPVVVLLPFKTGPTGYGLRLARVIRVPEGLGRTGDHFLPYMEEYVRALEDFTMEYPFQFFNFYDMWKRF
ncbi:MAG: lysophospholipid acyltransferase family protein [Deltaproteobacteria bacterium]|nr:lysophospholipid acyltransferase family protein [Deltaproteobacteria bacterium]